MGRRRAARAWMRPPAEGATRARSAMRWLLLTLASLVRSSSAARRHNVTHQQAMHDLKCVLREGQSNEDFILLPLLFAAAGHSPGTFVEIGAYDGSDGSQTHLLENCFGWSGVLIEASNRNYDKLTKNERRKPPTQKVYSAVCARGVGTVTVSNGGGTVAGVTSDMAGGFSYQKATENRVDQKVTQSISAAVGSITGFSGAYMIAIESVRSVTDAHAAGLTEYATRLSTEKSADMPSS